MWQIPGALLVSACCSYGSNYCFLSVVRSRLFQIQTRQPESLAAALSLVPSKRNERAPPRDAGSGGPRTLCRMSCERVCRLNTSDLHGVSHGRAGGHGKTISAPFEFWNAFRARTAPEPGPPQLCELSSAFAWRHCAVNTSGLQCAHKLLWLSHRAGASERA